MRWRNDDRERRGISYERRKASGSNRLIGSRLARYSALLASALLIGCVAAPTREELASATPPHLQPDAPRGIVDGRQGFRRIFCRALETSDAGADIDCGEWLYLDPIDDDSVLSAEPPVSSLPFQVVLVTGAFSECFGPSARPFDDAIIDVSADHHIVETIVVGGRSGSKHNARQIADFLEAWPTDPALPLVLIGYSKGTTDILQFLGDFPETAKRVDAVVSVAGSVGGSPLADEFDSVYKLVFSHLPSGHCPRGDGEVVHSLRTDVRQDWLRNTTLPAHIRYYSIAAYTTRERMARGLVPAWEILLRHDRLNDGQLLPRDALIPNSTLLGYLNADHWAVAMHLEDERPMLTRRNDPRRFPHTALLRAILLQLTQDQLSQPPSDLSASAFPTEAARPH